VTWTGNGTIVSGTDNELIKAPGAVLNQHVNGKSRTGTAVGTFDGGVIPSVLPGGVGAGDLGVANQSLVVLCRVPGC